VDTRPLAQLPWAVTRSEFIRTAGALADQDAACCVFAIDASIPREARAGYAALVIAYARAQEPVLILDDGAAVLLVREGGTAAAEVAARRVLREMERLALERTIRAGVADMQRDCDAAVAAARALADGADPGQVRVR
jgi:hypothetical protein